MRVPTHNVLDIHFWEDPYIAHRLTTAQAFFYTMLITRWPSRITGIHDMTAEMLFYAFRPAEFDLAWLNGTLETLQQDGKVIYEPPELWVVNYFRAHGDTTRPDLTQRHVARVLAGVHSEAIYQGFIAKYAHHPALPKPVPVYRHVDLNGGRRWLPHQTAQAKASLARVKAEPRPPAPPPELAPITADIEQVWQAYTEIMDVKTQTLTSTRRDKIVHRLADKIADPETGEIRGVTVEDLRTAIRACRASDWHMGHNPGGKKYNALEQNILRSLDQLQRWLEAAHTPPGPGAGPGSIHDAWRGQVTGTIDPRAMRGERHG